MSRTQTVVCCVTDGAGELGSGPYKHVKHFVLCSKSNGKLSNCVTICYKISGLKNNNLGLPWWRSG